ncbi:hypothetical protein Bca4012_038255 [Brassica carinata]|uniref:Uncharacterized protein n=1 Tax=Brassica carinata TaxID=52824 RepID=A0A8X7QGZ3_BRACI|nr:hypothetical protein Bca52824_062990 [Brassica carinata]
MLSDITLKRYKKVQDPRVSPTLIIFCATLLCTKAFPEAFTSSFFGLQRTRLRECKTLAIQNILTDPVMRQIMSFQENPQLALLHKEKKNSSTKTHADPDDHEQIQSI